MSCWQTAISYCGCPASHALGSLSTKQPFQYTSTGQVEGIISKAHSEGKRIRVVGNALSPNGIGLSEDTMLSLGQCDRVLHVDKRARTVTVEVRVTVVTKASTMQSRGAGTWGSHLRANRPLNVRSSVLSVFSSK